MILKAIDKAGHKKQAHVQTVNLDRNFEKMDRFDFWQIAHEEAQKLYIRHEIRPYLKVYLFIKSKF